MNIITTNKDQLKKADKLVRLLKMRDDLSDAMLKCDKYKVLEINEAFNRLTKEGF